VKRSGTTGTPPPHASAPERATETDGIETFRRPAGACRICLEKPVVVTTGYNSAKPPAFKQRNFFSPSFHVGNEEKSIAFP
jgi:hypothetical protein